MANFNNPHGYRPLMTALTGGPCRLMEYGKAAADANAIFSHDLVQKTATAAVNDPGEGQNVGALSAPGCATYATGTPGTTLILGVSLNYAAASVLSYHSVVDSPWAIYEAQCDGATSITVAGHVGKNANVSLAQAGSTTTKLSGMQINSSTIATTSTLDLRLEDFYRSPDNAEGANAILMVVINKHALANTAVAGV